MCIRDRTDRVRNDEVLTRKGEERKLLKLIRKRKTSSLGDILHKNCLQLWIIEGRKDSTGKKKSWNAFDSFTKNEDGMLTPYDYLSASD